MSVYTDSPSTFVRDGTIKPRLSQVYVEIPPSPFVTRLHRKENASIKVPAALSLSKMTSLKRKVEDIHDSSSKKLKHSTAAVDSAKTNAPCHHCRKRKPLTGTFALSCNELGFIQPQIRYFTMYAFNKRWFKMPNIVLWYLSPRKVRVISLWFRPSPYILQRYSLDLEACKNQSPMGSEQRHISGDYIFSCAISCLFHLLFYSTYVMTRTTAVLAVMVVALVLFAERKDPWLLTCV